MLLSVVIPVYNEHRTLGPVLTMVARSLPEVSKEIIVVDDCSTDGTREWLCRPISHADRAAARWSAYDEGNLVFAPGPTPPTVTIRPIFHERNKGKGGALQTGFAAISGDVLVIQDADLESDPDDWSQMFDLIAVREVARCGFRLALLRPAAPLAVLSSLSG